MFLWYDHEIFFFHFTLWTISMSFIYSRGKKQALGHRPTEYISSNVVFCIFDLNIILEWNIEGENTYNRHLDIGRKTKRLKSIFFCSILAFDFCFGRKTFCWHRVRASKSVCTGWDGRQIFLYRCTSLHWNIMKRDSMWK